MSKSEFCPKCQLSMSLHAVDPSTNKAVCPPGWPTIREGDLPTLPPGTTVDPTTGDFVYSTNLRSANERQVGGNHYHKLKIQHWDYVIANDIPYLEACAIKYLTRHRDKGGRADLEKAIHFVQKALEAYYGKKE